MIKNKLELMLDSLDDDIILSNITEYEANKLIEILYKYKILASYTKKTKELKIKQYQYMIEACIDQNDLYAIITISDLETKEKNLILQKKLIMSNPLYNGFCINNTISSKAKNLIRFYSIMDIILYNNKLTCEIVNESLSTVIYINPIDFKKLYVSIALLDNYIITYDNLIITKSLIDLINTINIKNSVDISFKSSNKYNQLKTIDDVLELYKH